MSKTLNWWLLSHPTVLSLPCSIVCCSCTPLVEVCLSLEALGLQIFLHYKLRKHHLGLDPASLLVASAGEGAFQHQGMYALPAQFCAFTHASTGHLPLFKMHRKFAAKGEWMPENVPLLSQASPMDTIENKHRSAQEHLHHHHQQEQQVKTTAPKKYAAKPIAGILLPRATCDVIVTMQAQHESPLDLQCKDKFLVQSVVAPDGAKQRAASHDLFNKELGKEVFESKLRAVYVSPPQSPYPVLELAEESISPLSSIGDCNLSESEAMSAKSGWRSNTSLQPKPMPGFSFLFVLGVGLLAIIVGYLLHFYYFK